MYFAPDGRLVERHRKLVPTGSERTVWGMGDGSRLRVVDTPHGRIGGLICWTNPVLHVDHIPAGFPDRERLVPAGFIEEHGPWIEPGNTVIVGPLREAEATLLAELDLAEVAAGRRFMDPTDHYNRPDIFQLLVDTTSRHATTTTGLTSP